MKKKVEKYVKLDDVLDVLNSRLDFAMRLSSCYRLPENQSNNLGRICELGYLINYFKTI